MTIEVLLIVISFAISLVGYSFWPKMDDGTRRGFSIIIILMWAMVLSF